MHFQLQGKGVLEIAGLGSIYSPPETWKQKQQQQLQQQQLLQEVNSFASTEPTSVLHIIRSPSPPTSASTLSSSFNGGGCGGGGSSTDNTTTTASGKGVNPTNNSERKDEWVTELQPIPSGLEIGSTGERCALGMEDWENMLSEPSQDPSLLRWIASDVDDTPWGLKQLLQSGNGSNPVDFERNGGSGLGIVDEVQGFEGMGGMAGGFPSSCSFSGSGFTTTNSNNNGNGKIGSGGVIPGSTSGMVNYRSGGLANNSNCNVQGPVFGSLASSVSLPVSLPPGIPFPHNQHQQIETLEEKPQILNSPVLMNQQQSLHPQSPNSFVPLSFPQQESQLLQPQLKRHNPGGIEPLMIPKLPFSDPGHEFLIRKHNQQHQQFLGLAQGVPFPNPQLQQKPMGVKKEEIGVQQQQQHALLDQLYKAAELVGTGNFSHAQGILARLNHQLSPIGRPLHRAAFYFKEALQLLLLMNNNPVSAPPPKSPTPFDVIFKMGAYKVFSEVSPFIQFVNFTCNQALLEALVDADRIHIIDFDIGFGAQWASFMQELPRNRGAPSLKITAFASPATHHPVELGLMRENLAQFANEIGINFELDVINFDYLEQSCYSLPIFRPNENEAIAVNFPVWASSNQPSALLSLLRFVKQLSPKIVVSLDQGCDRSDLPFPQHILRALESYIHLLESLDAANVTNDAVNKIEKYMLQPRIESTVLGRLRAPDTMPHWKAIFASAGFLPVTFSNFTETQAECLVNRTPVRGFHVEKRHTLLMLCWQRHELISASAWRC